MAKKKRGRTKTEELDPAMLERASRTLRTLAHPVRLKMVEILIEEPVSVGDLAEAVNLPPAAVSQHLGLMRANRVVQGKRRGRQMYYEVVSPQAHYLIDCLRTHASEI